MWIQIIVSLFVIYLIGKLYHNFRHGRLSRAIFISWTVLWLGVVTLFWSPEIASRLAEFFGIGRGVDLIVYLSVVAIFYLIYRLFIRFEKLEREITVLTREQALHVEESKEDKDSRRHPQL